MLPKKHQIWDQRGITLMEIMIVVAVIVITALFAGPEMENYRNNARLKDSARDIYSNIQSARMEAGKRNQCIGVVFTTVTYPAKGGSYSVFRDNGLDNAGVAAGTACDGVKHSNEVVISPLPPLTAISVNEGVSLVSANNIGGTSSIIWKPNGVTRGSQSGNIQLRMGDRGYKITVAAAGGMRLEMSENMGVEPPAEPTWRN